MISGYCHERVFNSNQWLDCFVNFFNELLFSIAVSVVSEQIAALDVHENQVVRFQFFHCASNLCFNVSVRCSGCAINFQYLHSDECCNSLVQSSASDANSFQPVHFANAWNAFHFSCSAQQQIVSRLQALLFPSPPACAW